MSAWLVNNIASEFLLISNTAKLCQGDYFLPICLRILEPCSFTCTRWMTLYLSFCSVTDKLHRFNTCYVFSVVFRVFSCVTTAINIVFYFEIFLYIELLKK